MGTKATVVYFYYPDNDSIIDLDKNDLEQFSIKQSYVKAIWNSKDLSDKDIFSVVSEIEKNNIERIVIAGFKPGFRKSFFAEALQKAGKKPEDLVLADFGQYCNGGTYNQEIAKAMLFCAFNNVPFEFGFQPAENSVNPETLVIGAGIAGIQASLEVANSNNKVFLVEKTGTIGGHMAMFDKTFPTLDCAACILTPKMVEIGQHPNIDLLTYSEVINVKGSPGNYHVKILKKARRVDLADCIGCGICSEKCPSKTISEFDAGTTLRKAIYIPFPQAVPNKYLIDAENCIYVENGKCGVCVKVCPPKCIDLDQKDEEIEITVGNIIVATGFQTFDAKRIERFGYGQFPNVLTSIEFERLINAAGPTEGNITYRTKDKKGNWIFKPGSGEPSRFAIVHCVGSRDRNYKNYCSRVCCMYSLKLAHLIKEKIPNADVFEYFIDMRAFGKGYEEFYQRIKEEDVNIIRGKTAKIEETKKGLKLRSEDIINDRIIEQDVDMVILSVGLEPRKDADKLTEILNISKTNDGWYKEANSSFDGETTLTGGVTIAGACQGPKDIPDSVAQGASAAAKVIQSIMKNKINQNIKDISFDKIEKRVEDFQK